MWWARDVNPNCGDCYASAAIRCCRVDTVVGFEAPAMFPSNGSVPRHPLPSAGSGRVPCPCVAGTMGCSEALPPLRPCSVAVAQPYHPVRLCSSLPRGPTPAGGPELWSWQPRANRCRDGDGRASQVPGGSRCAYALFLDPGRTRHTKPLRCAGAAPAPSYGEGSRDAVISGLDSRA